MPADGIRGGEGPLECYALALLHGPNIEIRVYFALVKKGLSY